MNISIDKMADFISDYRTFRDTLFQDFQTDIKSLSKKYSALKDEWRRYNRTEAESFNIFRILELKHYEVSTHSSFLRELLDSDGSHGQGNLFFEKFLVMLSEKKIIKKNEIADYTNSKYDDYLCTTEHVTDNGRIDIFISQSNKSNPFRIIIENKIYAIDQENQIERYWQWLDKIKIPQSRKKILYLTLDGRKPEEKSISEKKRTELERMEILYYLSYKKDIKSWLQESYNALESSKVKYIITQYLDILDFL